MNLQDCIQFATENPVCYLATMDGEQPRVRTYLLWFADENGFYFATFSPKGVCKQLQAHPLVEVCFYNNAADLGGAKHMRVTGKVEFIDDLALKTKLLEDRPFYKPVASGKPEDPFYQIFRIHTGEAHFWTMADIMKESELERIKF
jgi:uncharacterized pyridoxamine 5'-phosphate oxidase family protein